MPFEEQNETIEPLPYSAALTHHWLVRRRGGEKVLEAFGDLLPEAPVYTLVHDPAGMAETPLADRRIVSSWLGKLPGASKHYPKMLPLMPLAARSLRLPPVELVLCSDAAIAKAMTPHPRSKLVCYCHSPMRYVYEPALKYAYTRELPWVARPVFDIAASMVKRADVRAARRVDLFIANSRHVAQRIKRYYQAEAAVVHPPVELPTAPITEERTDFYLCLGYHTPYKRLDLAVEACRRLGRRLVVIGNGPDLARYDRSREVHVDFLGWQPDEAVRHHLRRAAGLLFPGEEDFGIVPVEAMAHGCPVIAFGVGGATETVAQGLTGVLFDLQTADCLADAMRTAERMRFDPTAMHEHARQFSRTKFLANMRAVLEGVVGC